MSQDIASFKDRILEQDIDMSKLVIKDKLNSSFWQRGKLSDEVAEKLIEIATDFYSSIQESIPEAPDIEDITFTGSLASYNYHEGSDIDLHILVDFASIGKSQEILAQLFAMKRIQWNGTHDIMILGHEVEIYIQDTGEDHEANGVFSIQDREWLEMPSKERVEIDFKATKKKYESISLEIAELSKLYSTGEFQKVHAHTNKLKTKVKNMRNTGLEGEGVYSAENLAFKMLRLHGDLEKLTSLQHTAYDKMMSIPKSPIGDQNITENWWKFLKGGKL